MDWKSLERHPLSAEYEDLKGSQWTAFVANLQKHGVQNGRKVMLAEGMVIDAWQLHRGCVQLDIQPEYEDLILPPGQTLEEWVEMANDLRRHETAERIERRAVERRKRVVDAARKGLSERQIADQEGISKTQVHRDLQEGGPPGPRAASDPPKRPENAPAARSNGENTPAESPAATGIQTAPNDNAEPEDWQRIREYLAAHPTASNKGTAKVLEVSEHVVAKVKTNILAAIPKKDLCKGCRLSLKGPVWGCKGCAEKNQPNEKATTPKEDEKPWVDGWGIPITKEAAAAFRAQDQFDELLKKLRECKRIYKELAELPGGAYLTMPGISVNSKEAWRHNGLETCILNVADCRPTYTVCPYAYNQRHAHDSKCTLCKGLSWIRPLGKEEVPASLIAAAKTAHGVQ